MYYPYSENKGADSVTAKLICVFVFAYAKSRFSHNEAPREAHINAVHSSQMLELLGGEPVQKLMESADTITPLYSRGDGTVIPKSAGASVR